MQRRPLFFTKATTNLWRLLRWDFWTVHGAEGLCRINSSSARAAGEELIWLNSSKFKNLASVVGRTKLSTFEFLNSRGRRKSHQKKKKKKTRRQSRQNGAAPQRWAIPVPCVRGWVCECVTDDWLLTKRKRMKGRPPFFSLLWCGRWQKQDGADNNRPEVPRGESKSWTIIADKWTVACYTQNTVHLDTK